MQQSPVIVNKYLFLVVALAARTASCDLWGIDYGGDVYKISPTTGIATFSATTSIAGTNSLAVNSEGVLYTVSAPKDPPFGIPPALYTVNPMSGATTLVTTLTPLTDCRSLAFAPDGTLYAIRDGVSFDADDYLTKINLSNGVVTDIGPTHFNGIQALDFSPSGLLYGWDLGLLRGVLSSRCVGGRPRRSPDVQFVEPSTMASRSSVQASTHPAAPKSAGPGPSGKSLQSPAITGSRGMRRAASRTIAASLRRLSPSSWGERWTLMMPNGVPRRSISARMAILRRQSHQRSRRSTKRSVLAMRWGVRTANPSGPGHP